MGNETLNVYPSIEAIDEVRVLTSNYGAQYGRNASGTVHTPDAQCRRRDGNNRGAASALQNW